MEGKAVHPFVEVVSILEYVPEGYELDEDEAPPPAAEEVDEIPEFEEETEKIEEDETMRWDEEEEEGEEEGGEESPDAEDADDDADEDADR